MNDYSQEELNFLTLIKTKIKYTLAYSLQDMPTSKVKDFITIGMPSESITSLISRLYKDNIISIKDNIMVSCNVIGKSNCTMNKIFQNFDPTIDQKSIYVSNKYVSKRSDDYLKNIENMIKVNDVIVISYLQDVVDTSKLKNKYDKKLILIFIYNDMKLFGFE